MNLWIWIGFLSTLAQISSFTWGMRAAGGVWYAEKSQYLCMISGPIYLPITNINTTQINSISSFYFILPSQHKVMSKAERCWAIRGKSSDVFFLNYVVSLFCLFMVLLLLQSTTGLPGHQADTMVPSPKLFEVSATPRRSAKVDHRRRHVVLLAHHWLRDRECAAAPGTL